MANWLFSLIGCLLIIYGLIKLIFVGFPAQVLKFFMKRIHANVTSTKEILFKEAFNNVNTNNKSGKLEILEIG